MTHLLRDKILSYDRPVPRYTSYPTAPHFQEIREAEAGIYSQWLRDLPPQARLSLYLHVPFCQKMCWYCGCHTKITQRYAPVEDYAHLMMREIDMLGDLVAKDAAVQHIHFGGGSPGLLHANDFTQIMQRLCTAFQVAPDAEIAIEIDPRGVTAERTEAYAAAGVNRISLGVQDFDQKVLEAVNRPQPFSLSYDAVRLFRQQGISRFNIDLLYGLPHQTPDNMRQTIDKALLLMPDRISLFGYAHVPWMKKHMRLIEESSLPDKRLRFDLFEAGASALEAAGYVSIGIDHFAKPDDPLALAAGQGALHRNFQGYTTDSADALLGIGASAIGKLPQGYIQNAVDLPQYRDRILDSRVSVRKFFPMSAEDHLRAAVIERLMCDFAVNLPELCEQYGMDRAFFVPELAVLAPFESEGFVRCSAAGRVELLQAPRQMARLVCAVFDAYLPAVQDTPRHARAI
ncbi:MAG: oxygen-independent coproporphyrinogen III oxidase [Rhodospirillales bacterium]|nr:oxygen-independent coproporphyrinogen III oxidase [Rhodospirillales bacterium]